METIGVERDRGNKGKERMDLDQNAGIKRAYTKCFDLTIFNKVKC